MFHLRRVPRKLRAHTCISLTLAFVARFFSQTIAITRHEICAWIFLHFRIFVFFFIHLSVVRAVAVVVVVLHLFFFQFVRFFFLFWFKFWCFYSSYLHNNIAFSSTWYANRRAYHIEIYENLHRFLFFFSSVRWAAYFLSGFLRFNYFNAMWCLTKQYTTTVIR